MPSIFDVVGQALRHTREQLLPFRWSQWWRIALLGLAAGEFGGFSGGNGTGRPSSGSGGGGGSLPPEFFLWIAIGFAVAAVIWIVVVYVNSVARFMLIEAIVQRQVDGLRAGWRRWRVTGRRFFRWQVLFLLAAIAAFVAVVGVPCLYAYRQGWFAAAEEHVASLILGGIAIVLAMIVLGIIAGTIYVLTKDFAAPIMSLEGSDTAGAWRQLRAIVRADKGSFAAYVLLKIVLTIAVTAVMIFLLLLLLSPLIVLGVGVAIAAMREGWSPGAIGTLVAVAVAGVAAAIALVGFLSVPLAIFFPAYGLYFLAPRYPPLAESLASRALHVRQ
jgi:hypothetical protein